MARDESLSHQPMNLFLTGQLEVPAFVDGAFYYVARAMHPDSSTWFNIIFSNCFDGWRYHKTVKNRLCTGTNLSGLRHWFYDTKYNDLL